MELLVYRAQTENRPQLALSSCHYKSRYVNMFTLPPNGYSANAILIYDWCKSDPPKIHFENGYLIKCSSLTWIQRIMLIFLENYHGKLPSLITLVLELKRFFFYNLYTIFPTNHYASFSSKYSFFKIKYCMWD